MEKMTILEFFDLTRKTLQFISYLQGYAIWYKDENNIIHEYFISDDELDFDELYKEPFVEDWKYVLRKLYSKYMRNDEV